MTQASLASVVSDERGVVFLEFLVAVVPVWTLALSAFQLSLILAADLVVKHAADSAARSASVVLADDPGEYGGEPEGSVDGSPRALANRSRSRMNTIRLAAQVPLVPFSFRSVGLDPRPTLKGPIPSMLALGAALVRRPSEVAVTFAGADGERLSGPEVTVRVTYAFRCLVPIARRLLCDGRDTLKDAHELPQATSSSRQTLDGSRFRLLTHQTTLLIHDAPYEYRSRGS